MNATLDQAKLSRWGLRIGEYDVNSNAKEVQYLEHTAQKHGHREARWVAGRYEMGKDSREP